MDIKLSSMLFTLFSVLTLAGCQTPSKNITLNQNTEERTFILLADIPDSDSDGVLDDIDNCPKTPKNVAVDELGCPMLMDLMSLITMEYRAFFSKGSSELLPKYQLELDKIAEKMNKYDNTTMQIEAHISEDEMGQALSALPENRAMMVKNYLILKHDIEPSRLSTFDCSIRAPIAPSDTEEGKSFNRRVYGLVKEPKVNAYNDLVDLASKICVEF